MRIIVNPEKRDWPELMRRAETGDEAIAARVAAIVERVRRDGDKALYELSQEIEGVRPDTLKAGPEEIAEASRLMGGELKEAINTAASNIEKFHMAQLAPPIDMETAPGVRCVQRAVRISKVGLYIPGGTAPLFSTVLMLAIPARVAGCARVVLCTPPDKQGRIAPEILYAASVCGVEEIYKIGGAQAIAAMAYGTQTVPAVDKIFGPGNRYVTKAKQLVSTDKVAIDMPAGPSEVMVLADSTAVPAFVASDLLSQAEHGADSQAILVTDSMSMAQRVGECVEKQLAGLVRRDMAVRSLDHSRTVVMDDRDEMIDFANEYAAEHLIISMDEPWKVADKITAAGSVFIGNYSPESAGDYASGTNHTLPTCGWARSFSGVNTDSFTRKITYQELTPEGLENLGGTIVAMAEAEGLQAHANAVKIRIEGGR